MTSDFKVLRAAGAVVWRKNAEDDLEILLIHRPKYDDWSFPKGKVEANESLLACAYREVKEETGYEVVFGSYIGEINYLVDGLPKKVKYWSAHLHSMVGEYDAREVDQVVWYKPAEALIILSRQEDIKILESFLKLERDTQVLILLRHAKALARNEWNGDDGDRPLIQLGQSQADFLALSLRAYAIEEIHTSDAVRCYETVRPLAQAIKKDLIFASEVSEYGFERDELKSTKYVRQLLKNNTPTLVCSHNPVLPYILEKLITKSGVEISSTKLEPASAWVINHLDTEVISIDFMPGPTF